MKASLEIKFATGKGACTEEIKETENCAERKGYECCCASLWSRIRTTIGRGNVQQDLPR